MFNNHKVIEYFCFGVSAAPSPQTGLKWPVRILFHRYGLNIQPPISGASTLVFLARPRRCRAATVTPVIGSHRAIAGKRKSYFVLPLPSSPAVTYIKRMSFLRRYITLGFALVFMVSGVANAYARAMMAGSHSIEICSEMGNNSVTLGVNGEKLPTLHDCSSCCIAVGMLQDVAPHVARSSLADMAAWRGFELALNTGDAIFSTWPRGPPIRA